MSSRMDADKLKTYLSEQNKKIISLSYEQLLNILGENLNRYSTKSVRSEYFWNDQSYSVWNIMYWTIKANYKKNILVSVQFSAHKYPVCARDSNGKIIKLGSIIQFEFRDTKLVAHVFEANNEYIKYRTAGNFIFRKYNDKTHNITVIGDYFENWGSTSRKTVEFDAKDYKMLELEGLDKESMNLEILEFEGKMKDIGDIKKLPLDILEICKTHNIKLNFYGKLGLDLIQKILNGTEILYIETPIAFWKIQKSEYRERLALSHAYKNHSSYHYQDSLPLETSKHSIYKGLRYIIEHDFYYKNTNGKMIRKITLSNQELSKNIRKEKEKIMKKYF